MSGTPLRGAHHNRDLPALPWRAVTEPHLLPLIQGIPDGPFRHNACTAETAWAISGWWDDQTRIPPANSGFHPGFIRSTAHRKEARGRLILNIKDSIAALEHCCGVGCVVVIFQGEQDPALAQIPASLLTLDERNIRLIYGETFQVNTPVFSPAIGDVRDICLRQLGVAYLRDFRIRAHKSHYFANTRLEPETATKSLILQPAPPPGDLNTQPLLTVEEKSHPTKPRFDLPSPIKSRQAATPERSHRAFDLTDLATPELKPSGIDSVYSQLSSMRLIDTFPVTPTPSRSSHATQPVLLARTLPADVYDLLTALGIGLPIAVIIGQFLILSLRVMTVSSTSEPRVKSKARAKPAPKSDEQHAREKEDNITRKMKLKAAIDTAIGQIDDIIGALADEYNIGFSQACSYVHLGARVFKDRRRPTIQNAYRFCWARVEDGRWKESDGGQIAEAVRIVKDSEKNEDEYRSLSESDQAILIALLQGDRDQRDTGIVGKSQLRLHDIRTTMEKVDTERVSIFLVGCRSEVDHYSVPTVILSEAGCEFITQYLRFEPSKLAKHFDAFATNRAGMNGIIRRVASDEHGGDKKTATKSIIMGMFKKMYTDETGRIPLGLGCMVQGSP
ncbi:hypothetical protein BJV78DRAFT_1159290 [Lactifluus subvellereus]|nr:hypothetical protein BJV78DRAFT_1159290 [Lactifluus subvellereus]